jgi:transposase
MTRRPLVLARATKPLHQTRSLDEVVSLAPEPAAPGRPDPGLSLLADRRRVGRAGAPGAAPRQPAGWPAPKHPLRQVIDAIRYLVRTGCAWRLLAHEFPPPGTVYGWVAKWAADGTLARVHDTLPEQVRLQAGGDLVPSAAIIDSQSVRAADTVPRRSRGWDAGKKVNGRKRHLAVDTLGLLLVVMVTAAGIQDRDAGRALLWRLRASFRGVRLCWADGGYAGRLVAWAAAVLRLGSRSCASARASRPSRCCRAGGWWSGPWPGSPGIAAPCATTSGCPTITPRWSPGPWSR